MLIISSKHLLGWAFTIVECVEMGVESVEFGNRKVRNNQRTLFAYAKELLSRKIVW